MADTLIDAALRPVGHRLVRLCTICKQFDDHPHHIVLGLGPDGTEQSDAHLDCCRDNGCHDGSCATILAESGQKRHQDLVDHLTAQVVALDKTAADRDKAAAAAHEVHAARQAFIHGAALAAAEAAALEFDAGPQPVNGAQALLDAVFANALLAAEHDNSGATVRLSTGPMKIRLMTTVGSAGSNGTELATSGGYVSGTGAGTVTWGTPASQSVASSSTYTVSNMPATTLNGVEEWDSAGTPLRKQLGGITGAPKTTNAGDTFTIATASLTNGAT